MLSGVAREQGIVDLGVPRSSRGSGTSKINGLVAKPSTPSKKSNHLASTMTIADGNVGFPESPYAVDSFVTFYARATGDCLP